MAETKKNFQYQWEWERDFIDGPTGTVLRLEKRVDMRPAQYRWLVGFMVVPRENANVGGTGAPKFIPNIKVWIERHQGRVSVRNDSVVFAKLFTEMHEYLTNKEQLVEDDYIEQKQQRESRGGPRQDKQPMGLKKLAEHDKKKREERERQQGGQ